MQLCNSGILALRMIHESSFTGWYFLLWRSGVCDLFKGDITLSEVSLISYPIHLLKYTYEDLKKYCLALNGIPIDSRQET